MNLYKENFSQVGQTYKNFVITKAEHIEELSCFVREVEHQPSGAQIVHICSDDPENVFCIALRTLPEDSSGVAHILEHTVLCGSDKYPVKDPFFSMNRRSLNTYMNALTAPDFTCYPAASQVPKDFYNLLEVYLDAVFYPQLKKMSFLQEGHRLEYQQPEDSSTPLTFKGIVFNEMKGTLSSPMSRLWKSIMQQIFPDILYRHNYGGQPLEIPKLSYEGLKAFHQKYYQESRATFYFYGDLPIEDHLDFLEEKTLKEADKLTQLKPNPIQGPLKNPSSERFAYPVAEYEQTNQKTYFALCWLTTRAKDQLDILALQIIDVILMGNDAAPLKRELLKSGLCQNVHSILEDELSQVPYGLIFEGCEVNAGEQIQKKVKEILTEITASPVSEELIAAAMHQIEFSGTEINSDYGPFGLSLILKMVPVKNVEANLENCLKIHTLFDKLRKKLKDPKYLSSLIEKWILFNPHQTLTCLYPDAKLNQKEQLEEQAILKDIESKLSVEKKKEIVEQALKLKDFQEEQECQNIEVLPKVTLADVSKQPRKFGLVKAPLGAAQSYFHPCFTNGIVYQDVSFKMPKISFEDLPYVRLFAYLITQLGSKGRDYATNLNLIQSHTGGIVSFLDCFISIDNPNHYEPHLIIKGKSLERNYHHLTQLMADMVEAPIFEDSSRLKELITQLYVEMDHDLKQNSLRYAVNLSCSSFYQHSYVSYFWSGLGYYYLIKKIAHDFDNELPKLIDKMVTLKDQLLHGSKYDLITTCSEKFWFKAQKSLEALSSLPLKKYQPWEHSFEPHKVQSQTRVSSSAVFFTSMALKTVKFVDPSNAHLSIASRLLDNTVLHRMIREQGGAYGGGSSNKMSSGKFCFYAYRDPNLASTIEAFKIAVAQVSQGNFTDRELEEAKLGIIQKLDHPIAPEYQGITSYSWEKEGKSYAVRQKLRSYILNASKENICSAVSEQLLDQWDQAIIVSFASKSAIDKESEKFKKRNLNLLDTQTI